jgi:hypothetical protein
VTILFYLTLSPASSGFATFSNWRRKAEVSSFYGEGSRLLAFTIISFGGKRVFDKLQLAIQ